MGSDLDAALRQFEAVEANLKKLERLWGEMEALLPEGICFDTGGPDSVSYSQKRLAWAEIVKRMPAIDGWSLPDNTFDLNEIAQARLDAREMDEITSIVSVEEMVSRPTRDLHEYRFKLDTKRRGLVRGAVRTLLTEATQLLDTLHEHLRDKKYQKKVEALEWDELRDRVAQIDTLLGSSVPRPRRWGDLHRHLNVGQIVDLKDIIKHDWPQVITDLETGLYHDDEPMPVEAHDLGELVASKPTGPVVAALKWGSLTDDDFERLIFCLISDAEGYEDPQWLTRVNAPDRGRDLSVFRTIRDSLGGTKRERVIIQCKHWQSKSIGPGDVTAAAGMMGLWEPPPVDALIIASSGRFTTDAVDLIEKRNNARKRPNVEMWPDSHLERRLAERPHLVAEFKLKR